MKIFIRFYRLIARTGINLSHKVYCSRTYLSRGISNYSSKTGSFQYQCKRFSSISNSTSIANEDEITEMFGEDNMLEQLENELKDGLELLRSSDPRIQQLRECISVEDVLNFIRLYQNECTDQHLTQTVVVLKNIQNVFQNLAEPSFMQPSKSKQFLKKLMETEEFNWLLKKIEHSIDEYDVKYLNLTMLYLYRLGIHVEYGLIQKIATKIRDYLLTNFSLNMCAILFKVIFAEYSIRPYNLTKDLIPKVIERIDNCNNLQEFEDLTICLNKLNNIVTIDILHKYLDLLDFSMENYLKSEEADGKTLLTIMLFLNYPQWRDLNTQKISKLMILMKNKIDELSISETLLLYKMFFKNQEPGEILNDIQRHSAKYLQRMEDLGDRQCPIEIKLQLFSSLIFFSSPNHRMQFKKDIAKYVPHCYSVKSLTLLRNIYSYTRVSDPDLCRSYWDKMLNALYEDSMNSFNIANICKSYISFNTDIDNYRHYAFENRMLQFIKKLIEDGSYSIYPKKFSLMLSFIILYGKSAKLLEIFIDKLEEIWKQLGPTECFYISNSIYLLSEVQNKFITDNDIDKIKHILMKLTEHILVSDGIKNELHTSLLLKSAIYRNDFDQPCIEDLITHYKLFNRMSSKILENICFIFSWTNTLVPEVINNCTEYVIKNNRHILGFNAEKILFLCFKVAYLPINSDNFFNIVTDIILRDQERLSGLSFLQCALALCYFNRLPKSIIKMIFNSEFLEKLDTELINCYAKDIYIHRVRKCLMVLNRSVCLEYPECNVPWFHKKYLEEMQKKSNIFLEPDSFILRVKNYLEGIVGNKTYVLEHVISPYGYHIDFVLHLNCNNEVVKPDSSEVYLKLAILLCRPSAYTKLCTHLRGEYQLKKRHLEMLGYKVVIVKYNEWVNLLYAQERIDFVRNIIWPQEVR